MDKNETVKKTKILKNLLIALSLFLIDAFFLNQGIIALVALLLVLPVLAIRAILKWKDKVLLKRRFVTIAIYSVMVFLIMASNNINNKIAFNRATTIISACDQYKIRQGVYPEKLNDLIPKYLDNIPSAKYTFSYNQFRYISSKDRHSLMFISIPPFGRQYYVLEEKKWGFMD
jgi:hypothetical protein